jgi:peptidoglycan hydrolase CwlO-like protein
MEDSGTTVAPALDDASVAKIAAAATDAMTVALTDVLRVVPTLEAAVASLQGQLDTANERADQEKQRADRAESQVRELQEQLTAEMIEHRQMVALLLKRRSWWRWRR